jgi:hypothetical protein
MNEAHLQTLIVARLYVSEDLQAVLQLQQTSQQLQAAVAQILQGRQLPVAFSTISEQQLRVLPQWLLVHAGLLLGLQLQINPYSTASSFTQRGYSSDTGIAAFIGTAAQRAVSSLLAVAAESSVPLQSLTLRGTTASRQFLQQLPAAHLTELHVEVDFRCRSSMQALTALSRLRRLSLEGTKWDNIEHSSPNCQSLVPLTAALQQLTELRINAVTPDALQLLPPQLQQLHIIGGVENGYSPQTVLQLAEWVGRRGSLLRSLQFNCEYAHTTRQEDVEAAFAALAAAFAAAAAVSAPAAGPGLQLASLSVQCQADSTEIVPVAPLLMALPASSLTHLDINIRWASEADVAALCSLTGLRSLQLQGRNNCWYQRAEGVDLSVAGQSDSVLAQLSVLQQLTRLELQSVRRVQLQQLQLPRLQHLDVTVADSPTVEPLLALGDMTGLTALAVEVGAQCWSPADVSSCHQTSVRSS